MKKAKLISAKRSLLMSVLSLILCFAMLLGTTFAWFTDSVTSGINQIVAGNLDVELYHAASGAVAATNDNKVDATTMLFDDIEKWEPGVVAYENFMVKNVGNLALKYQLTMSIGDFNKTADDHNLKEVLKVAVVPGGFSGNRADAHGLNYTTLEAFSTSSDGALLPNTEGDVFGVVIYWEPNVKIDNDYNLNNGKTAVASEKFGTNELGIELGINLFATQLPHEEDSFDEKYDAWSDTKVNEEGVVMASSSVQIENMEEIEHPEEGEDPYQGYLYSVSVPATPQMSKATETTVFFPDKTVLDGSEAEVKVECVPAPITSINKFVAENQISVVAEINVTLLVDNEEVSNFNTQKILVESYVTKGMEDVTVRYVGTEYTGDDAQPTDITYDKVTGRLTFCTTHFSEYDVSGYLPQRADSADEANKIYNINSEEEFNNFRNIVNTGCKYDGFAGWTVNLNCDIYHNRNLSFNNKGDFTNISKWIQVGTVNHPFKGTFNGNGHTIHDVYMECEKYEANPDCSYWDDIYDDAGEVFGGYRRAKFEGTFGYVENATITNLNIDNACLHGTEPFSPRGIVAGQAKGDCTFKDIKVTNSEAGVAYSGWHGGTGIIVGEITGGEFTFENIFIDSNTKITYRHDMGHDDTDEGGIVAYATASVTKIHLINCDVACQIDTFNDCIMSYKAFQYRNNGMLVGRMAGTDEKNYVDKLDVKDCTVRFGDWSNYVYYRLLPTSTLKTDDKNLPGGWACANNIYALNPGLTPEILEENLDHTPVGEYGDLSVNEVPFRNIFFVIVGGDAGSSWYGITEFPGVTVVLPNAAN